MFNIFCTALMFKFHLIIWQLFNFLYISNHFCESPIRILSQSICRNLLQFARITKKYTKLENKSFIYFLSYYSFNSIAFSTGAFSVVVNSFIPLFCSFIVPVLVVSSVASIALPNKSLFVDIKLLSICNLSASL